MSLLERLPYCHEVCYRARPSTNTTRLLPSETVDTTSLRDHVPTLLTLLPSETVDCI